MLKKKDITDAWKGMNSNKKEVRPKKRQEKHNHKKLNKAKYSNFIHQQFRPVPKC